MKLTYRKRLFLYFAVLFIVFTAGIALFEHSRELAFKKEAMESRLDGYADMIRYALVQNQEDYAVIAKEIPDVLPSDLRVTVVDLQGKVLYDNAVDDFSMLGNHSERNEIEEAALKGKGSDVRESASNRQPYLYYAKRFSDRYVRVALPYDIQLRQFLKADNAFIYFLGIFLLIFLFFIHKVSSQFATSIRQLRDFALHIRDSNPPEIQFPNDELGEIGKKITENYLELENNRKSILIEKRKLLQHIQTSEEGVCFFSPINNVEFYNGLFIQYLNQLTDEPASDAKAVFSESVFASFHDFLKQGNENYFETRLSRQGKIFSFRVNLFDDESYEIILNDISKQEKTRQLKQEMTGNIAHELRTPIAGIRGYLETVLEQDIPEDKKRHFIRQAYNQSLTLSEMIKDMGVIAKMEEAPDTFELEGVNIGNLLQRLKAEEQNALMERNMEMAWQLPPDLTINGNPVLLYSIFKNLTDNAIRYAGTGTRINISLFKEDADYCYFSFYDTGAGIEDEAHLNRLFERFYRVHQGRSRDTGGSGLGLSIVRNSVHFHRGRIAVKNRKEGGLEFLFQLHK